MKKILIVSGSKSDENLVKVGTELLENWEIQYDYKVLSAHRNLKELMKFIEENEKEYFAIIAVAGLAAALPGVIASLTQKPVVGVPNEVGTLKGIDALLSMTQMPGGVPVATMGIGKHGMKNAVYFVKRLIENEEEK
jgi:5-(carboxyamino)imidazole ribonucleotide mutase